MRSCLYAVPAGSETPGGVSAALFVTFNTSRKGYVHMLRALVHDSSFGASSLCFSQSSRSLVSRSDWEMRSKANAPVKRSS
jgi:hypothetical protein